MGQRVFYVGGSEAFAARVSAVFSSPVGRHLPADLTASDVCFLEAFAYAGGGWEQIARLPGGSAFSACRELKATARPRVYLLVQVGDAVAAEVARFCLADGVVEMEGAEVHSDLRQLVARVGPHRPRVSVDALLQRLEQEIRADSARHGTALRRLLRAQPSKSVMDALTDPETGLFDGAYAALKIDEEYKRATRFHQPLTLILLDLAPKGGLPAGVEARQRLFAEAAGVFLNECRDIDILARFTEGVFLFLLPGTGAAGAAVVARRMLTSLSQRFEGVVAPCAGLTTVPAAGIANREAFLVRAEACLLLAKDGAGDAGLYVDRE